MAAVSHTFPPWRLGARGVTCHPPPPLRLSSHRSIRYISAMLKSPQPPAASPGTQSPRLLHQVPVAGALFCLSCSNLWDPYLIGRCPNEETSSADPTFIRPVSFGAATNFAGGIFPYFVAVGDVNGN